MRSRGGAALLTVLVSVRLLAAGDLVERVLAVVDGRPVLLSEVRLRQRLQGTSEAEALEGLIDELLMYEQAARLPQAALRAEEEERAVADARSKLQGAAAADEGNLRRLARRQGTILKYVEFRFRPQARVSDEELKEAFDRERAGRADAPSLEEAAPALRETLVDRSVGASLDAWVKELRSAAAIRYVRDGP
jgi:hypothetical protein